MEHRRFPTGEPAGRGGKKAGIMPSWATKLPAPGQGRRSRRRPPQATAGGVSVALRCRALQLPSGPSPGRVTEPDRAGGPAAARDPAPARRTARVSPCRGRATGQGGVGGAGCAPRRSPRGARVGRADRHSWPAQRTATHRRSKQVRASKHCRKTQMIEIETSLTNLNLNFWGLSCSSSLLGGSKRRRRTVTGLQHSGRGPSRLFSIGPCGSGIAAVAMVMGLLSYFLCLTFELIKKHDRLRREKLGGQGLFKHILDCSLKKI